ncbi:conserved hypothetical protein [Thiocapsa sp. KS1]|nr:tellurite resistance TerB family protein [Thiocapsa sp. KS1]CRI66205.1 conserved hypothetical protein [Thiocapsa sp. KS1]
MANFGDLLGSFIQSNMTQSGSGRMGNALQDLQANLGRMVGGQSGGTGGDMLGRLLEMAKGTLGNASQNPMQAGGLGAVLGSVLGGGGKSVKGAMTGGALAMLAGIAYKAFTESGQAAGTPGSPAHAGGGELPLGLRAPQTAAEEQAMENTAQLVIKGMINVAKSDGQVSVDEIQRIVGKIEAAGMGADAQEWLMTELRQPLNLDAFVAEIPSPEVAAEVYAASLLAVEVDTAQEKDYLRHFAEKAGLHPLVVQHIHQSMGVTF